MRRERQICYDRAKIKVKRILRETASKNHYNLMDQEIFEVVSIRLFAELQKDSSVMNY